MFGQEWVWCAVIVVLVVYIAIWTAYGNISLWGETHALDPLDTKNEKSVNSNDFEEPN